MPKRQASDAIHIAITDHRIARRPAPQLPLIEQHDGNTPPYTGQVIAYYPNPGGKLTQAELPEANFRARRFDDALKLAPDNWRYLYGSGRAKQDIGLLERAWALAPWETNILPALAAAYFEHNRIADAVRAFREATERDPEDAAAFGNLGNALLRSGDSAGAEKAFREAIRLEPNLPQLRNIR
jgi:superkiller protein 3